MANVVFHFRAITPFQHYEYSIQSHGCLHILYRRRLLKHSEFLFGCFRACYFLLWYSLCRQAFHNTLVTSAVLIREFFMFNHFNKNPVSWSRDEREIRRMRKHIFDVLYAFFIEFMNFASNWFIIHVDHESSHAKRLSTRIFANSTMKYFENKHRYASPPTHWITYRLMKIWWWTLTGSFYSIISFNYSQEFP